MKTVVVFGATGNLGAPICMQLKADGNRVIAVGNRKCDNDFFEGNDIPYYSLDIKKIETFNSLDDIGDIDAVCHFAGSLPSRYDYDPQDFIESITIGTLNVLKLCRSIIVRKLYSTESIRFS